MRLTSWITLNLLIALSLSACSVYQSQGRKQFDSYAPGRTLQTNVGISALEECWTQPIDQEFWNFPTGSKVVVRNFNENEITYCLGRPDETTSL